MINVKNVSYKVANHFIVDGISFEAKKGEVLAIIGANGAGKSTLLKLLCKEISPSKGKILFSDRDLESISHKELARMRSVLTQHHTVSLSFMVTELVMMGRYPHFEGQPTYNDGHAVRLAMEATGITHMAGRSYHTLSGGEQQRVQLARAIAQITDVEGGWLFLDEPTNGLDLLHQQQLLNQARKMASQGFGVICILHDINHAAAFADKILVLKKGKQLGFGTPAEIINREMIAEAFGVDIRIINNDEFSSPLVVTTGEVFNNQNL